ncbi:MAG: hypothetical protein IJF88_01410 [Oscillospiraceae bacterium]|nr:hypothetical protein [Oscillospiraceae bacterium]
MEKSKGNTYEIIAKSFWTRVTALSEVIGSTETKSANKNFLNYDGGQNGNEKNIRKDRSAWKKPQKIRPKVEDKTSHDVSGLEKCKSNQAGEKRL